MMKKKIFIILTVVVTVIFVIISLFAGVALIKQLFSKIFENPVIASLPEYESSDCYQGEGFQDYTDYCKYYFSNNDTIIEELKKNKYFKPITEKDIEEVKSYFENFNGWVKYEEYKDKYDFKYECIDTLDFFYIENKDNCEKYENYPDKYSAYNVYFFDMQTTTLFFIHSNI